VIESTLDESMQSIDELKKKFFGVAVGLVINPLDPMMLGRVQVQLPFIDSADLSPWARVATPMTGVLSGHYFIPNMGDEVLVAFEHGDVNAPYIIGSLWNAAHPPPLPSPLLETRVIRTPLGNQLGFREVPPAVTITTPDMTPAAMAAPPGIFIASNETITLMCGPTTIMLTPAGITIHAPSVNVVSDGPLTETATSVTISAAAAASVQAGGVCAMRGSLVEIN
jgi:phage baseplate assembly protein gpV